MFKTKLATSNQSNLLSLIILLINTNLSLVLAIIFDEVVSLNVWITVSSLANKDPGNKANLLFRQIELNWINAPLNDESDYIALFLDSEPLQPGGLSPDASKPVSVHKPNGLHGRILVPDYHLPLFDFYNETKQKLSEANKWHESENEQEAAESAVSGERALITNELAHAPTNNIWQHDRFERPQMRHKANSWNNYHDHRQRSSAFGSSPPSYRREPPFETNENNNLQERRRQAPLQPALKSLLNLRQSRRSSSMLTDECLGYCVAYFSQNKLLAKSCLKTYPNWMKNSRLGTRSITTIAIPGTHNSGTYSKQPRLDRSVLQMINKYQLDQEESVFNQLVYGIRYLDLRVGFSKLRNKQQVEDDEFWIYHDIFRTENSLRDILEQVKLFLDINPQEVVIIDFHRFTVGFQNEDIQLELKRHGRLLDLLFKLLGNYIVPSYLGQNAPISEYIALDKRLFVGYAERSRLLASLATNAAQSIQSNLEPNQSQPAIRDVDADKQEQEDELTGAASRHWNASQLHDAPFAEIEKRMGNRIYNRLKSFKLISRSFSKRSVGQLLLTTKRFKASRLVDENKSLERDTLTSHVRNDVDGVNNLKHQNASLLNSNNNNHKSLKLISSSSSSSATISAHLADSLNEKLSLLFNHVHHIWPNTDKEDQLRQFIEQVTCRKYHGELNSLMAELTPTVFGAISDKYDGIRKMSHQTNRMVSDLIRSKFLHCINLVASDFFLGNDLIRLTIFANKMRQSPDRNVDLNSIGHCKSFRRISNLLRGPKLLPVDPGAVHSEATSTGPSGSSQPDGIVSEMFSSFFKRIFSL